MTDVALEPRRPGGQARGPGSQARPTPGRGLGRGLEEGDPGEGTSGTRGQGWGETVRTTGFFGVQSVEDPLCPVYT